jgi:hypothetical protein
MRRRCDGCVSELGRWGREARLKNNGRGIGCDDYAQVNGGCEPGVCLHAVVWGTSCVCPFVKVMKYRQSGPEKAVLANIN